jgi:hypothetical protein
MVNHGLALIATWITLAIKAFCNYSKKIKCLPFRRKQIIALMTIFIVRKENDCKIKHVMNWLSLFVDMHNREIMEKIVK